MSRLRDRFWIWGHPVGAHDTGWGFQKHSRMTAAEGAYYLGAKNVIMVCYGNKPEPPFDQEAMALDPMVEVIWSVVGDGSSSANGESLGHLDEILRIAKQHKNIRGAIFDDFFAPDRMEIYTPTVLSHMRSRLHNADSGRLDMWVVLYGQQLDDDIQKHIDEFDGVTYWTWWGKELKNFEENFQKVKRIAAGKRLLLGCYLYDYGDGCEMSAENMEFQLNRYAEAIRAGEAEGVILLSNVVADLGFEAVEYTKKWLKEHGDEEV